MGVELVGLLQSQESSLQPDYGQLALFAVPSVIVALLVLVTLVLAVTDRGLSVSLRLVWALLIVAVPVIGAVIYLVTRGKQRISWFKSGSKTKSA
ncbi:PLDc N-terminal domain-containing protein [Arthrobacter sp. ov118]|jgi:hypothetical protein|uniref:PLDc N-terminal domain-containing protein n=1 Tax=Arthrobacter sp. ov118 TaxID=1761747 RepID=UPI0008E5151C|nr:PLDc N-terminal domain-containing protein [Arthrobacter sp. ov118]SFT76494.1 Phospholipase_D-nuclease N-terminal [Arthrobacter sp. ov118]